jgi:hypothetical protein
MHSSSGCGEIILEDEIENKDKEARSTISRLNIEEPNRELPEVVERQPAPDDASTDDDELEDVRVPEHMSFTSMTFPTAQALAQRRRDINKRRPGFNKFQIKAWRAYNRIDPLKFRLKDDLAPDHDRESFMEQNEDRDFYKTWHGMETDYRQHDKSRPVIHVHRGSLGHALPVDQFEGKIHKHPPIDFYWDVRPGDIDLELFKDFTSPSTDGGVALPLIKVVVHVDTDDGDVSNTFYHIIPLTVIYAHTPKGAPGILITHTYQDDLFVIWACVPSATNKLLTWCRCEHDHLTWHEECCPAYGRWTPRHAALTDKWGMVESVFSPEKIDKRSDRLTSDVHGAMSWLHGRPRSKCKRHTQRRRRDPLVDAEAVRNNVTFDSFATFTSSQIDPVTFNSLQLGRMIGYGHEPRVVAAFDEVRCPPENTGVPLFFPADNLDRSAPLPRNTVSLEDSIVHGHHMVVDPYQVEKVNFQQPVQGQFPQVGKNSCSGPDVEMLDVAVVPDPEMPELVEEDPRKVFGVGIDQDPPHENLIPDQEDPLDYPFLDDGGEPLFPGFYIPEHLDPSSSVIRVPSNWSS